MNKIDPKIVKTSLDLLTKIVKKPVITDKLLKRPPFRFLHDLITSIIKSHGFFKDLYKDNELVAENVKEKESKIVFLQKAIDTTGFIIGDVLSAKPSKIVAGLEADKTNEWLQAMAKAVIAKKDSSDAVQRVLNGEKPTKRDNTLVSNNNNNNNSNNSKKKALNTNTKTPNNTNKKTKKESKESKEIKTEAKNAIKESNEAKEKTSPQMSANKAKHNSGKQSTQELTASVANGNTPIPAPHLAYAPITDNRDNDSNDGNVHKERDESSNDKTNNEDIAAQNPPIDPLSAVRATIETKSVLSSHPRHRSDTEMRRSGVRPPTRHERTARPSSSRPAPPRVIPKVSEDNAIVEAELEEKLRLLNAKPVENLITENFANDEDQEFVVSNAITDEQTEPNGQLDIDNNNDTQKGSLVKQLVETKKELEGKQSSDVLNNDKKVSKQTNRDIEKLRQTIQALSQTASPLGKVLDYLQEDIDSMLSELKTWQEEYKSNVQSLHKSRNTTLEALEPYKQELNQLDVDIVEQMDKISLTKANIIRNEDKLQKMFTPKD
ncbi:unnamed protein product [Medioppia subpectinata]|uniref:TRAF3-interacting protein 1 n=1 Tax=Medioppia subpectinata TaxID=1979941 RepID=A0A7R9PXZ7_9ACAR|nr:unnamed protein product [Medioppia subpectinata]CAG2104541.1 unnamed protein product [Medioppia subpectinata]